MINQKIVFFTGLCKFPVLLLTEFIIDRVLVIFELRNENLDSGELTSLCLWGDRNALSPLSSFS